MSIPFVSIPAIIGAMLLHLSGGAIYVTFDTAFIGFTAALISGIIFLRLLVWITEGETASVRLA